MTFPSILTRKGVKCDVNRLFCPVENSSARLVAVPTGFCCGQTPSDKIGLAARSGLARGVVWLHAWISSGQQRKGSEESETMWQLRLVWFGLR